MVPKDSARTRRKRQQIRQGAMHAFLESGFTGTSMDGVAATAGVSKQTLYVYYRSKDELLVDVMSTLLQELDEHIPQLWNRTATDREDLRGILTDIAVTVVSHLMRADYLALVKTLIGELAVVPALGEIWRNAVPARVLGYIQETLRRAQDSGVIRDIDLDLAARMFAGPLMTFVILDGVAADPGCVVVPKRSQLEALVDLYLGVVT